MMVVTTKVILIIINFMVGVITTGRVSSLMMENGSIIRNAGGE